MLWRSTQGGAHITLLALGYCLSGFPPSSDFGATSQPFESVSIGVHPWLKLSCRIQ
jgi:hypothetical protein